MGLAEPTSRSAVAAALGPAAPHNGEQFFCFLLIGIGSSIVDTGLLYVLTRYFGIWYLFSATISYCCGILISYCLNRSITFHDMKKDYLLQFSLFSAVSIGSLILSLVVLFFLVDLFSFHYLTGKVVAIGISFFWNYYGQSRLTFRAD